jgi:hypothetical protein
LFGWVLFYYCNGCLYRHLATNEHAWQEARDLPDIAWANFPSDAMMWATAATAHSVTWPHIDDFGLATIVKVMAGRKYWVTIRPKSDLPAPASVDMRSTDALLDMDWEKWSASGGTWDFEGILLGPGDTL